MQHSNLVVDLRNVLKFIGVYPFINSLQAESCSLVTPIGVGVIALLSDKIDFIKLNITVIFVISTCSLVLRLFLVAGLRSSSFILHLLSGHIST